MWRSLKEKLVRCTLGSAQERQVPDAAAARKAVVAACSFWNPRESAHRDRNPEAGRICEVC